jgi:TP901 family phage tail tape measure protein
MMSDAFDARAALSIAVDLRQALNDIETFKERGGDVDDLFDRISTSSREAARFIEKATGAIKDSGNAARQSGSGVKSATKEWDALAESMAKANKVRLQDVNASNARNLNPSRTGGVFDQAHLYDIGSATKAADTSWVKDYEAQVSKLADSASPRLRYALYDVASTAGVASAALIATGAAVGVLSAQYESAFTNVERTLDGVNPAGVTRLREELMQLTRDIPLTFANISEIATLGNQLGIASSDIAQFTETTAKFSAVTGLTAEASAQAFGSLAQLLRDVDGSTLDASQFENLGSAIALVGRRSVATEAEIVSMSTRLAASASNAGFTAQQVVALSGAFASLRIAPERAQGVMEVYFNRLNTAINSGGDRLEAFAAYAGVATSEVEGLVKTDPVGFFQRLATGLGQLDQQAQTGALEQLGLQGIRAGEVFGRVSANVSVFTDALRDANQGWREGTELGDQYAKVVDDLASRWQIFLNAVGEAGQAVGNALAPAIKAVLDFLTGLLQGFAQLAQTPVGQWAIGIATALAGIVAVLGLVATGGALTAASFLALKNVMIETGIVAVGTTTGLRGMAAMMTGLGGAVGISTGAMQAFKVALATTGIGLAVVALGTLAAAFMSTGNAATNAFDTYIGSTAGLSDALAADTDAYKQAVLDQNTALAGSYLEITPAVRENTGAQDENRQMIANTATVLGLIAPGYSSANAAISENTQYLGENTIAWAKNQLMQNEAFQNLAGNTEFTDYWVAVGASMDEVIRASANGGEAAVIEYFSRLEAAAAAGGVRFQSAFIRATGQLDRGLAGLGGMTPAGYEFGTAAGRGIGDLGSLASGIGGQLALMGVSGTKAGKALADGGNWANEAYENLNKTIGGSGGGGGTTKKVRTLVDYANDLSSVMKRAFDIRFSGDQALDKITSGWQKIRQAALDAAEAADEHRRKLADMAADKSIKEYWLMVAENYGDELRAAKLRGELADLSADMTKEQKSLTKAQAKSNKTLVGNSQAAIDNRAEILGLVGDYQGYLQALAASGLSQEELQQKSGQLRAEFIQQATSLGYNRGEVDKYARAFDDMTLAVDRVPRNITVTANVNPALQALAELEAKAKSVGTAMGGIGSSAGKGATDAANQLEYRTKYSIAAMQASIASLQAAFAGNPFQAIGYRATAIAYQAQMAQWRKLGGFAEGGYTGSGGKFDPAGIVHRGEFVFSQQATKNIGVNNLAFLHNIAKSGKGAGPVGLGSAGRMVELSPYDRMLLQEIADRVGITITERSVQSVTNGGNANAAQRRVA